MMKRASKSFNGFSEDEWKFDNWKGSSKKTIFVKSIRVYCISSDLLIVFLANKFISILVQSKNFIVMGYDEANK